MESSDLLKYEHFYTKRSKSDFTINTILSYDSDKTWNIEISIVELILDLLCSKHWVWSKNETEPESVSVLIAGQAEPGISEVDPGWQIEVDICLDLSSTVKT